MIITSFFFFPYCRLVCQWVRGPKMVHEWVTMLAVRRNKFKSGLNTKFAVDRMQIVLHVDRTSRLVYY